MPGKHAPASPRSFYLSLTRSIGGALAALGLVAVIVVVAVSSRGEDGPPLADPTVTGAGSPSPTPTMSVEPTPEETPPPPLVPRRRLEIEVLNGTGRTGLAAGVEERMREEGYRRIEIGNTAAAERTTIFYRGSMRREARRLLRDFPEFGRIREARSGSPGEAEITVVLGDDHEAG